MSTLNRLQAAHANRCRTVTVCGVEVGIRPLTAAQAQPLVKEFADCAGLTADDQRLMNLYIEIIARSAVEPGTSTLALDSDDGRALLRDLPFGDLFQLGFAAAEASGLGGSKDEPKKN